MKTFTNDFFSEQNFILSRVEYDHRKGIKSVEYHICYNVNDPFFYIMGSSIISILENNKDLNLVFHIFTDGYSEDNANKIKSIAEKWKCKCVLYVFNIGVFQDFHIKVARFSRITYGRLYMAKVLAKETERFLYVDADAMCVQSIKSLFSVDLKGTAMGAVMERPDAIAYRAGYLKLKSGKYFNDGIMLVDTKVWEKQHITEKAFSYQCEPKKRFLGQSQDVLNLVFDGTNFFLPAKYNVYDGGEYDAGESVIVHWTGRRKPWQMVLTKFDKKWREYNALSPWQTISNIMPIKKPENYHDFQQWGHYQKRNGNFRGYLYGVFWYAILRFKYKL